MKVIYLDEAGTSTSEPYRVVSAVIIDCDKQWRAAASWLHDFKVNLTDARTASTFAFHGKELMNGGAIFSRENYSIEQRLSILAEIVNYTTIQDIPVYFGWVKSNRSENATEARRFDHMIAFAMALLHAVNYVRDKCPGEMCIVVAEDIDEMKKRIRLVPKLLRDPEFRPLFPADLIPASSLENVAGPIYFAKKNEDPLLEIADSHAFAARRGLAGGFAGDALMRIVLPPHGLDGLTKLNMTHGSFGRSPVGE